MVRELRGRLAGQFLWGSDFPFFTPERCLAELDGLGLPGDVLEKVLHDNALRICGRHTEDPAGGARQATGRRRRV